MLKALCLATQIQGSADFVWPAMTIFNILEIMSTTLVNALIYLFIACNTIWIFDRNRSILFISAKATILNREVILKGFALILLVKMIIQCLYFMLTKFWKCFWHLRKESFPRKMGAFTVLHRSQRWNSVSFCQPTIVCPNNLIWIGTMMMGPCIVKNIRLSAENGRRKFVYLNHCLPSKYISFPKSSSRAKIQ